MTCVRLGLCLSLVFAWTAVLPAQAPPSYAKQVQSFFTRYCVECHNTKEPEGGLVLESYRGLLAGGGRGAALVPGKPDVSRLVRMIEGKAKPSMPPKKARQPSAAEVAVVRAWVLAGARDDSAAARITLAAITPKTRPHTPVTALAFSPSGKLLAAAGRGAVLLLDERGELVQTLPVDRDRVTALAFSPKGGWLAAAASTSGQGHEVYRWQVAGDRVKGERRLLVRHEDVIQDLAFRPDGKILATASYDRLIKLIDVAGGKELRTLKDHSDAVYGVSFSPDGTLLASGAADRAVKVWDVATGTRLYTLGESTDWVYAVAWSPDGKHLAAGGVDRSIRVWKADAKEGKIAYSVFAHEGAITRLVYSTGGQTLYSLGEDRTVKAWDALKMVERLVYPRQADTTLCLAIRPDRKQLALGRYDGALVLLGEASGKPVGQPLPIKPRPPVLENIAPPSAVRGKVSELKLRGKHLRGTAVESSLPGLVAAITIATGEELTIRVTIPATAAPGAYTMRLKNEAGSSKPQTLFVDRFVAVQETEPNDSPRTGQKVHLPATLVGAIGRAGDLDWFRFEAKQGQEVGVQALTGAVGSKLDPLLRLIDPQGNIVAESTSGLLGHTCLLQGSYALGIRDREYRGGAGMHYRLHVGDIPLVTSVFPLGLQRGSAAEISLEGVHLGKVRSVRIEAPATAQPGTRIPVNINVAGEAALGSPSVVVGEFPEVLPATRESEVPIPGTANGRIDRPGDTQTWRFRAKKGQRLILEVHASRLGSPMDSTIEILDGTGRPLPRAVLRCLARTYVAFRDHDSRGPGIRIETWSELAVNDWILAGNELLRIRALPRNPDDDCQFFSEQGQRRGFLGTTPTFQSQGTPMYKVSIHPPGTKFPPNGLPLITLNYRNDDGPGLGKDSRLVFDPPADALYQVRVSDSRGEGGKASAYRLTIRQPRPDFTVSFSPTTPTVNRGGASAVRVNVRRIDEFDGPVALELLNLPPGFEAPRTDVPAGEKSTAFALFASDKANIPPKQPALVLRARAMIDGKEVVRQVTGGVPKPIGPGDIVTTTEQSAVDLAPGGEVKVTVMVGRRDPKVGRIPLDVQGLPHGVRVLDVGLNGILITPGETRRTFVLYAEPWVKPMSHPFVVLARREGTGKEFAAKSVLLRVGK
jgi:WD40 repeat protein